MPESGTEAQEGGTRVDAPLDSAALVGLFTYLADAAAFRPCSGAGPYPVAMEGAYIDVERAYSALALPTPGAPVLVRLEGELADRPAVDRPGQAQTLVVRRFIEIVPGATCEGAGPSTATTDTTGAAAQGDRERLEIPAGDSSVTRSGSLRGFEQKEFLIRARSGQLLRLRIGSSRQNWVAARVFPVGSPTGADLVNTFVSGTIGGESKIRASGEYVVSLTIPRVEARRGGTVDFTVTVALTEPAALDRPVAVGAPETWEAEGACPFEGCAYRGVWSLNEPLPLRGSSDEYAITLRELPAGASVTALTGRVLTNRGRFRFTADHPPFESGDALDVYDYLGEGRYRVWRDGRMTEAELLTSPYGTSTPSPVGVMELPPRQRWWVNVRLQDGSDAWIEVRDPSAVERRPADHPARGRG